MSAPVNPWATPPQNTSATEEQAPTPPAAPQAPAAPTPPPAADNPLKSNNTQNPLAPPAAPKPEETKPEQTKAEETKPEETKAEETKAEEKKPEEKPAPKKRTTRRKTTAKKAAAKSDDVDPLVAVTELVDTLTKSIESDFTELQSLAPADALEKIDEITSELNGLNDRVGTAAEKLNELVGTVADYNERGTTLRGAYEAVVNAFK